MSVETSSQAEQLKRRTERILLRIPIEVRGTKAGGKPFVEQTHTLAINRHGARLGLNAEVEPNSRLNITNLQNKLTCPFRAWVEWASRSGSGRNGESNAWNQTPIFGESFSLRRAPRRPRRR